MVDREMSRNLLDVKRTQLRILSLMGAQFNELEKSILGAGTEREMAAIYGQDPLLPFDASLLSNAYGTLNMRKLTGEYTYVHFIPQDEDIKKGTLSIMTTKIDEWNSLLQSQTGGMIRNVIVIATKSPTQSVTDDIISSLSRYSFTWFRYAELYFDITQHSLQPQNVKCLSDAEVGELLKNPGVKPSLLPIIKSSDIFARFHGWKKGDIVRVEDEDFHVPTAVTVSIEYYLVK